MAHTITGIDLGSRSVKFAVFDVGFRRVRLHTSFEEPVPPGEAPLPERQAEALRAGVARLPSQSTIHMALPGEMPALRVLDLPFSDARKVDQVVGYELEGQIMHDLSEVVMDHVILSAPTTGEAEAAGSRALAVASRLPPFSLRSSHAGWSRARSTSPRSSITPCWPKSAPQPKSRRPAAACSSMSAISTASSASCAVMRQFSAGPAATRARR